MKNLENFTVNPDTNIHDALKIIDHRGGGIALVVNGEMKLLGTVTDGDVRRGILSGVDVQSPVTKIMNAEPVLARPNDDRQHILSIMRQDKLRQIPIVDDVGCLLGLETLNELMRVPCWGNMVLLMAGGLGARLQPLTRACPKPMLKVGGRPILETIILNFIEYGFNEFVISLNYKGDMIRDYFSDGRKWGVSIQYIEEYEKLGTAGSLRLLSEIKNSYPIIVMNGDVLTKVNFEHLLTFHQEQKGIATMCIREYDVQIPFGVVNIKKQQAKSIVEKPIKKFFVNAGIYVLEPELVNKVKPNTPIDMPNLLEKQIKEGRSVSIFPIHEYWLDIGHMKEYESAHDSFSNGFTLDD